MYYRLNITPAAYSPEFTPYVVILIEHKVGRAETLN